MLWITVIISASILTFAFSPLLAVSVIAYLAVSVTRNVMGPLYDAWVNQRLELGHARHGHLDVRAGGCYRAGGLRTGRCVGQVSPPSALRSASRDCC